MRAVLGVLFLIGCAGDDAGLEAPASCAPGLTFVHDLAGPGETASGEGVIAIESYAFGNASTQGVGVLHIGDLSTAGSGDRIRIEFEDALIDGRTVAARGFVQLDGIDAGNCETGGFAGRLTTSTDGWRFTLVDLHAAPYCDGAAFTGSFAACFRGSR